MPFNTPSGTRAAADIRSSPASRLLVNALIAPEHRVSSGCFAHMMFEPYRGLKESAIVVVLPARRRQQQEDGNGIAAHGQQGSDYIEWSCVEFSPNGEPGVFCRGAGRGRGGVERERERERECVCV